MPEQSTRVGSVIALRALILLLFIGTMWMVRVIDTLRPDGTSIAGLGVIPRTAGHISGILAAPFIHANWPHLIANTVPLLILGSMILVGGVAEFLLVTLVCMLAAGAGTWLFGESANHIGASGVVFGYVGYLLFRAAFDRKLWFVLVALVVTSVYGTVLLLSLVPTSGVSWTAHFFGFIGGALAARLRAGVSRDAIAT